MAVHRMGARFIGSAYRPVAADFEQLAAACVDLSPFRARVVVQALEPLVKIEGLITRVEELLSKFKRAKR